MWKTPRENVPPLTTGMLVIESDDGTLGDYTLWFPELKEISHRYSQWYPYNLAKCTCNVNSATIGNHSGNQMKMDISHLKKLEDYGWEIASHGRHHAPLGAQPLLKAANALDTQVEVIRAERFFGEYGFFYTGIYDFRIFEGDKSEILDIQSHVGNIITLGTPIQSSYTTAAKVQITPESAHTLLQGCIDDLAAWGLECKHHAFTWHSGSNTDYSEDAVAWVNTMFDSGRGKSGTVDPNNFIIANLSASGGVLSDSQIDTLLDTIQSNDGVLFYYGHAEFFHPGFQTLKKIVIKAIERGIKLGTRTEAVNKLMGV